MDREIRLLPTNCIGSSVRPYELLKVLDNTMPVYHSVDFQEAVTLKNPQDIDTEIGIDASKILDEEGMADLELERSEYISFNKSIHTARSLYNSFNRTETELYILLADVTEKERRKLTDLRLRNVEIWQKVNSCKSKALIEINWLHNVLRMIRMAPADGELKIPTRDSYKRQMALLSSSNRTLSQHEFNETLLVLEARRRLIDEFKDKLTSHCTEIKFAGLEYTYMNVIATDLRKKWNLTKVPYEVQVYLSPGRSFPYRMEYWIELLHIPEDLWGIDCLNNPDFSNSTELWKAADVAGYTPTNITDPDEETWRTSRVKRTIGLPYFQRYPKPITSPLGNSYWCELFASSKRDQERISEETYRVLSQAGAVNHEICDMVSDPDPVSLVNLFVRLGTDLSNDHRESKELQTFITIEDCNAIENTSIEPRSLVQNSETSENQPVVFNGSAGDINISDSDLVRFAATSSEKLEAFLNQIQKQCMQRALYVIIQGQIIRSLRINAGMNNNSENVRSVYARLREEPLLNVTLEQGLLYLSPEPSNSEIPFDATLITTLLPPSFITIPLCTETYDYVCIPINSRIVNCTDDEFSIRITGLPLFGPDKKVKSYITAVITMMWCRPHEKLVYVVDQCSSETRRFLDKIEYIEKMSIFRLQATMLEILTKNATHSLYARCDMFRTTLPSLANNTSGTLLWANHLKWLLNHICTSELE